MPVSVLPIGTSTTSSVTVGKTTSGGSSSDIHTPSFLESYSAIAATYPLPASRNSSMPSSASSSIVSSSDSQTANHENNHQHFYSRRMNIPSNTADVGATGVAGVGASTPDKDAEPKPAVSSDPLSSSTPLPSKDTGTKGGAGVGSETKDSVPIAGTTPPSQGNGTGYGQNKSVSTPQDAPKQPDNLQQQQQPQQPGYYVAYPSNSQIAPEPPSPHTSGGRPMYDVSSFFQQPSGGPSTAAGAAGAYSPFTGVLGAAGGAGIQAPNSPGSQSMGGIPPASPLFPRMTVPASPAALLDRIHGSNDIHSRVALSPGPQYTGGMYMTGGGFVLANAGGSGGANKEDDIGWGDNRGIPSPYPPSPQISTHGIPFVPGMPGRAASDRSSSFDDTMLPPSIGGGPPGHPYGGAGGSPVGAGTLFAHQQSWNYGSPIPDSYTYGSSPLQPRPAMPYPSHHSGGPPPRHQQHRHPPHHQPYDQRMMSGPYGGGGGGGGSQYFPATSPGPPIQTAGSNKGPDGANLFIFHIPNHFTNIDMYQLFVPYGNLLSVRIMVEKDTGRSRGFGFVSYDSPDSAALAIKELNGFAIGNKRLKVQHKQIRPLDPYHDRYHNGGYGGGEGGYYHGGGGGGSPPYPPYDDQHGYSGRGRGNMHSSLPPSGPSAGMYNRGPPPGSLGDHGPPLPPQQQQQPPGSALVDNDPRSSSPSVVGTPGSSSNGGGVGSGGNGGDFNNGGPGVPQPTSDALGTMDTLRQTLPDVNGPPTPVGAGEN